MEKMIFVILFAIILLYVGIVFWQKNTFRFISVIVSPFVKLLILRRVHLGLENEDRKNERFGIPSKSRPSGKLIWIHAVSVGEVLSCIPFVEEFKNINKKTNILFTTTTLTGANMVEQRLKGQVVHQFIPFDVFMWVRRFVKYWKPDAVFFIESEIWPNMLHYLHEKNIPTYLLNTRISENSLKRMYLAKKFLKILPYSLFTKVFVPSEDVKEYVLDLGAKDVSVIPNLKIISKKLPVDQAESDKLFNMINGRKVWMAISTHKGEEEKVIEIHKRLKNVFPDVLTVIAIRHPARANEVKIICETENISSVFHTEIFPTNEKITTDIYVLNQLGCLGEFLEKIDTIFVGGSLIPGIGGHNIIEPINFMCNVATGKYIDNFRNIYPYFSDYCTKVEDEDDLFEFVENSIESYKRNPEMLNNINYTESWIKVIKQISKSAL